MSHGEFLRGKLIVQEPCAFSISESSVLFHLLSSTRRIHATLSSPKPGLTSDTFIDEIILQDTHPENSYRV